MITASILKVKQQTFETVSVSNPLLAEWIKSNLEFDQLILEYPGKDPRDGWVHCSYNRLSNRGEVLTAVKEKGGDSIQNRAYISLKVGKRRTRTGNGNPYRDKRKQKRKNREV